MSVYVYNDGKTCGILATEFTGYPDNRPKDSQK